MLRRELDPRCSFSPQRDASRLVRNSPRRRRGAYISSKPIVRANVWFQAILLGYEFISKLSVRFRQRLPSWCRDLELVEHAGSRGGSVQGTGAPLFICMCVLNYVAIFPTIAVIYCPFLCRDHRHVFADYLSQVEENVDIITMCR